LILPPAIFDLPALSDSELIHLGFANFQAILGHVRICVTNTDTFSTHTPSWNHGLVYMILKVAGAMLRSSLISEPSSLFNQFQQFVSVKNTMCSYNSLLNSFFFVQVAVR